MAKMLCSGDGHVQEPWTLWSERLPKSMRDRFTGIRRLNDDYQRILIDDKIYMDHTIFRRPDGSEIIADPEGRMRDLELDGVWAETLVPNAVGFALYAIEDPEYAIACARVINDYLVEAYLPNTNRQIPLAVIPLRDVDLAVAEIERVAKLGIRGINLPTLPPQPYHLGLYEPVWRAATEHGMPVSFHVGTGAFLKDVMPGGTMGGERNVIHADVDEVTAAAARTANAAVNLGVSQPQQVMGTLIGSGVAERYPDLHFTFVEAGIAWLPYTMEAMDRAWTVAPAATELYQAGLWPDGFQMITYSSKQKVDEEQPDVAARIVGGFHAKRWPYPLMPSDYVRRQFHSTFMDEVGAIAARSYTGIEPLVWGGDYPHPEGTWPRSIEVTDRFCAGLTAEEKEAILGGTLAKLYGIEVPDAPAVAAVS